MAQQLIEIPGLLQLLDEPIIFVVGLGSVEGHSGVLHLLLIAAMHQERRRVKHRRTCEKLFEIGCVLFGAHPNEVDITVVSLFQTLNDFVGLLVVLGSA